VDWEYNGKICSKGSYGQGPTGEDRRETTEIGYFQTTNPFGLTDMHGQVREWCTDVWHATYEGASKDGSAWLTDAASPERILRGGSWNGGPNACRSAFRGRFDINAMLYDIGFRVACIGLG
jgi:formylglycine-generating enzyme required for sulfatase activity